MDRSLDEVWESFLATLDSLGLHASFEQDPSGREGWDALGVIEGTAVAVELKAAPGLGDVLALEQVDASGAYKVLAGRRVSAAVREALAERDIGFFDGRGHLRIWRQPLLIDATVPALPPPVAGGGPPRIDTPSRLDVALAVLDGTIEGGVRATAALLGRSPGTVSKHLAALRAAHLVDDRNEPSVPELFETVLDGWHPNRVPLADLPRLGAGPVNQRLRLGFDDPDGPGWVLADAHAAAAWGAPVVLAGDAAPDFYVPDPRTVGQARVLLGDAEYGRHACTVAVAPAPFVCRRRHDRTSVFNDPFYAPSPVVAALDLAVDPARGRETLELWSRDLSPEIRRVW